METILQGVISWDQQWTLYLNAQGTPYWDSFMWIITNKLTWIPMVVALAYCLFTRPRKEVILTVFSIALLIVLCDTVTSSIIKPWVARFRPTQDPVIGSLVRLVHDYRGGKYGFVSSHASNSFGIVCFTALLFRNKLFTVTAFAWAFLNTYSRVYLGVHYILDVVCGALFGILSALLIYELYKYAFNKYLNRQFPDNSQEVGETPTHYKKKHIYFVCAVLYISVLIITLSPGFISKFY
ncbi:MAG: phosphatase PAP2 family protein [Bacteroidales bacterium]|jgi:undecaprenyl-diphosphatase|nr:phosphatase PAP2 family protein [Bacteroidales bacterium]